MEVLLGMAHFHSCLFLDYYTLESHEHAGEPQLGLSLVLAWFNSSWLSLSCGQLGGRWQLALPILAGAFAGITGLTLPILWLCVNHIFLDLLTQQKHECE